MDICKSGTISPRLPIFLGFAILWGVLSLAIGVVQTSTANQIIALMDLTDKHAVKVDILNGLLNMYNSQRWLRFIPQHSAAIVGGSYMMAGGFRQIGRVFLEASIRTTDKNRVSLGLYTGFGHHVVGISTAMLGITVILSAGAMMYLMSKFSKESQRALSQIQTDLDGEMCLLGFQYECLPVVLNARQKRKSKFLRLTKIERNIKQDKKTRQFIPRNLNIATHDKMDALMLLVASIAAANKNKNNEKTWAEQADCTPTDDNSDALSAIQSAYATLSNEAVDETRDWVEEHKDSDVDDADYTTGEPADIELTAQATG